MKLRDVLGIILIGAGVTAGTVGQRILGLPLLVCAGIPIAFGMLLIWSTQRDQDIRNASIESVGDWGDSHYFSGSHATDHADSGSSDY